ncbi:hypothetical protein JCM3770_003052 [Rhodotorula araucariae]
MQAVQPLKDEYSDSLTGTSTRRTPTASRYSAEPSPSVQPQQYTADEFNYADIPRPFKNPYYTRQLQGQGGKRNKSLKQILSLERERVDRVLEDRKQRVLAAIAEEQGAPAATAMQVDSTEQAMQEDEACAADTERRLQEAFHEVVSYASVEAPPSLMPPKRYCDVTGLDAKYTDPKSMLRYHNPEVYDVLRTFQPAVIQAYLAVRGQGVVLR